MFHTYQLINKLANKQRRVFERLPFSQNFSPAQGRILHFLLNNPQKEIFQKDLENEFGLRPPSATSLLKTMEENGLILREASSRDARYKKITTTEKVLSYKKNLEQSMHFLEQQLEKDIDPKDLETWKKVTLQFLENLD